ncbi:wax ester/triacylglycerol synthase domain-containing protein [Geodermatophilus sp. SYSU D00758]
MSPPVERAGAADLAMRAVSSRSPVPNQLGAVLVLDTRQEPDPGRLGPEVARRLAAVPRLRQRLVRLPPGAGSPAWVDDPAFDPAAHVREVPCPEPRDDRALLDLATAVVTRPLPADRPAWAVVLVPGLAGGRTGLVVVASHVVVDGIGGLAVLAHLADGAAPRPGGTPAPRPRPPYPVLAADAARSRARAVLRWRSWLGALRPALTAGGGLSAATAAPCSLLAPTGSRRCAAAVRVDLAALRAAAHAAGGTVNDALLVAVTGALSALLASRGEAVDPVVVVVMVTARRSAGLAELGNAATPLVVPVPVAGEPADRLRSFAGTVRRARDRATVPPLLALLGPLFRLLAGMGAYHWYLSHQRRFHTLVSDVPGPDRAVTLAGVPVTAVLPVAVGEAGNVTVSFDALSYAGTLTVTAVADPERLPDLPVLLAALERELAALVSRPAPAASS